MIGFILALVLLSIALLAMALQKTYAALGNRELKRRARAKDPIASALYKAAAYGASLRVALWAVIVLTAAGSLVLFSRASDPILAFLLVAASLAYGFVWMPAHKATKIGLKAVVVLTPAVAWFMDRAHPWLDRLVAFIRKHRPITVHTGLYDKEDLLNLIAAQKHQTDSRISPETLDLLAHTLTFGEKMVSDCMVPRRAVKAVAASQPIGPSLIDELHTSGYSRFPVYDDSKPGNEDAVSDSGDGHNPGNIVGTIYLRELITLKKTGLVSDAMRHELFYVHEDHPLEQVLDAFLKTRHHMFVVVNGFEEFVGIITIEDILEQILGCKIVDEFDRYDDVRAVAAHQAQMVHHQRKEQGSEVVQDKERQDGNPYPESTLKHVIYEAGFRGDALEIAYGVAMAESGGKPTAHNDDESTGDDSYGLFQINMLGDMGPERRQLYGLKQDTDLFEPLTNAKVAFELSQGGKDWQPWTMYTNDGYKKYYDVKANHKLR